MPVPDTVGDARAGLSGPVTAATLHGWARERKVRAWRWRPRDVDALATGLRGADPRLARGVIARGLGRSYGDAAQRAGGTAVELGALSEITLHDQPGIVTVGAGVSLSALMKRLAPAGWLPAVVPGTQWVTVGGAIASDVHGKNHLTQGTFSDHLEAITLLTADGRSLVLTAADPLYRATVGGMGLTGVITSATLRLTTASVPYLSVDTDRHEGLDAIMEALMLPGGEHRVAWLDLMVRGGVGSVRGVVTRAGLAESAAVAAGVAAGVKSDVDERAFLAKSATGSWRLPVPPGIPNGLLRPELIRAANALRFRRAPVSERGRLSSFAAEMFPLDALADWPRLYGPAGFVQYQFAVPTGADETLRAVISTIAAAQVPVYLAVLKILGEQNAAPLSFPLAGWTLALDMPQTAPGLAGALDRCDQLVAAAGGRVYLTKDSRLAPEALSAMYPRLGEWQAIRDGVDPDGRWRSDLAARTGLVSAR